MILNRKIAPWLSKFKPYTKFCRKYSSWIEEVTVLDNYPNYSESCGCWGIFVKDKDGFAFWVALYSYEDNDFNISIKNNIIFPENDNTQKD